MVGTVGSASALPSIKQNQEGTACAGITQCSSAKKHHTFVNGAARQKA